LRIAVVVRAAIGETSGPGRGIPAATGPRSTFNVLEKLSMGELEYRVWFHDVADRLCLLPADWTSAVAEDPFHVIAAGRAAFRVEELLELVRLIGRWKP
jgi:hypothetical protein